MGRGRPDFATRILRRVRAVKRFAAPGCGAVALARGFIEYQKLWTCSCDSSGSMNSRIFFLWAAVMVLVGALRAELGAVYRAQSLLGPETWSQVVRIDNAQPNSAHPAVVYALVFELERRLWIYAPHSGTESLSLVANRLERDKQDLAPLLREIHPGFRRHTRLPARFGFLPGPDDAPLPHGCFVEAVAYVRTLLETGVDVGDVRLLAYYAGAGARARGHAVLYFEHAGGRFWFDPATRGAAQRVPENIGVTALAIARATMTDADYAAPTRAVFLPLRVPVGRPADKPARAQLAVVPGEPQPGVGGG